MDKKYKIIQFYCAKWRNLSLIYTNTAALEGDLSEAIRAPISLLSIQSKIIASAWTFIVAM